MTETNRMRLLKVKEVTIGTTPASPAMQTMRVTGEDLDFALSYNGSNEMTSDRLLTDVFPTDAAGQGTINFELSYGTWDDEIAAVMMNDWVNTTTHFNVTADSSITDAGTVANTYAVASGGASYVLGHVVQASGFTNAANNQSFRVASSTATTVVGTSLSLTAETVPPAGARLKVIGFEGVSGDITATSTGLASTTLNFTTLGLTVGQAIKIGGTTVGQQFATAALNTYARITAITATALTLDNRPTGWATDSGTGKTIRCYVGDYVRNGTTKAGFSIEKGWLGQNTPTYELFKGVMYDQMTLSFDRNSSSAPGGQFRVVAFDSVISNTSTAGSVLAASTSKIMSAVVGMGRLSEAGAALASPNFAQSIQITVGNNLRTIKELGTLGALQGNFGDADVSINLSVYYGDKTLKEKVRNGTETSLFWPITKDNQAYVFSAPRLKPTTAPTSAGSRNQDVVIPVSLTAMKDSATSTHLQIDRFAFVA